MNVLLGTLLSIILLDLVLSGDNAIVIGAAASTLPKRQRTIAIFIGGGGAIVLRIALTGFISWLLELPYLQVAGGILLIFISIRLLAERSSSRRKAVSEARGHTHITKPRGRFHFAFVLLAIMLADTTTSLDNMVAVGALAAGNFLILSVGLIISITILLIGSALIARVSARFPWVLDVAVIILAFTAANTILADNGLSDALTNNLLFKIAIFAGATGAVLLAEVYFLVADKRFKTKMANAD